MQGRVRLACNCTSAYINNSACGNKASCSTQDLIVIVAAVANSRDKAQGQLLKTSRRLTMVSIREAC